MSNIDKQQIRSLTLKLEEAQAEVIRLRELTSDGDCIPRSEVEGILGRAIAAYAQEKMQQLEDKWVEIDHAGLQWHHQYTEFYGLISFISGAALSGRGKMLLAAIGETPDTGKNETNEQLRAVLEGNKDMIAGLSGSYTSLLSRAESRGTNVYQWVRDGWGHIVNQYLIGLNYLRNTGKDDLLVEAAARYSQEAEKLRTARAILAPGKRSSGVDIRAFTVANVLALQELNGGSREENIQRYVDALYDNTERSDFENNVQTEILKSKDPVTKVLKWIQREQQKKDRLMCRKIREGSVLTYS